jgi:hypothetical protein
MDNMLTWPIIKGTASLVGMLAIASFTTNKILAVAISEDTPITLKAACYVGGAILTIAIWINKNLSDAKTAAKLAAEAATSACTHAESANKTAVRTAEKVTLSIEQLKIQLDNLPCHKAEVKCPPKPS